MMILFFSKYLQAVSAWDMPLGGEGTGDQSLSHLIVTVCFLLQDLGWPQVSRAHVQTVEGNFSV